jgi:glutamyl/glutaminyl-tRNA synthetase
LAEGPLISEQEPVMTAETVTAEAGRDFIRDIVQADLDQGRHKEIVTRFPPEPNGYLHIGHAKSIALNFGIAQEFGGRCNLRFDDTNPTREEQEYIDSIQADVRWLGYQWAGEPLYASDYFERLYEWAEGLIRTGLAYVDDQSQHDIRVNRGTLTEPGKNSPFRERSVAENLDLFRRMKAIPCFIVSCTPIIRAPATNGRSIRATTTPTASRMRSRASRIRSARWSSRITGRFMIGCWTTCRCPQGRTSTSSRGSI